jgi:hypothetical protein
MAEKIMAKEMMYARRRGPEGHARHRSDLQSRGRTHRLADEQTMLKRTITTLWSEQ